MPATLKDIAQACKLNVSTVSRALRDDPLVKSATIKRVKQTAEKLGYIPNVAARSLVGGKTQTVYAIIPSLHQDYDVLAADAASTSFYDAGYDMVIGLHQHDAGHLQRIIKRVCQVAVDGVLILPLNKDNKLDYYQLLSDYQIPYVCMDRRIEGSTVPLITSDNQRAAFDIIKQAHALGARKICLFNAALANSVQEVRARGVQEAIEHFDLQCIEPVALNNQNISEQSQILLFAENPEAIHESVGSLEESYYHVALFDAPLPYSINGRQYICEQDFEAIGKRSVEVLCQLMNGESLSTQEYILPPKRIYRI